MKYKRLAAAVLAVAVVLAGYGGAAAPAAPAGPGTAAQSAADTAVQTAQNDRITEQFTLEKTVRDEYGITQKLTIHVPQLECDSPEIEPQQDEWCPETYINWDAYWYGDCVSLVVSSCYGGTDAPFYQGWCFDFESGKQLTATQLLQRMGADPAALEEALYRDVKRRDEQDRQAACERGLLPPDSLKEGNTAWWATLDELPLSFDEAGNVSFVVRRSSAAQ